VSPVSAVLLESWSAGSFAQTAMVLPADALVVLIGNIKSNYFG
jgi:hypothetical protein